ncbi:hypothetical protein Zmor_023457 [Zophobas morio]|uniref:Uncharacterized protein n=1 Tax=Zophobas morio TaxID=2755281 RepID=A0AA38HYQ2_9CUCU|nr:hypothetical protein Zmor_023457 [Zophobas morio]
MDDVAKRREARRRKILENSQNRLNRISGVEEKSTNACAYDNHTENATENPSNSHFEINESNETFINEVQTQQNPVVEVRPPQKQYRKIVISALAVFVNVLLLLIDKLELDATPSHSNKIFLPLLVYEVIELLSSNNHRNKNKNFLILLAANLNNKYILPVIKYVEILTNVLQDVMVYFFVFVCCELVKYLLRMVG